MFVSSVCTRGSVCVVVGRALLLGVCLLAEVSVCLSQGSGLSLASAPLCVLGMVALGTPSCASC